VTQVNIRSKKIFKSFMRKLVAYIISMTKNFDKITLNTRSILFVGGFDFKESLHKVCSDVFEYMSACKTSSVFAVAFVVGFVGLLIESCNLPYKLFKYFTMARADKLAIKEGNNSLYNSMFKTVFKGVHFNKEQNRCDTFEEVIKKDKTAFDFLFRLLFKYVLSGSRYLKIFNNVSGNTPNFSDNPFYTTYSPVD